jgi:RNA polymerase sigma-70 factor, ECF subfamily
MDETDSTWIKLREGGEAALGEFFGGFHDRLERMIEFRLDDRLRGRIDPEDVLQEAWIEVSRRLKDYLARPQVSLYVWVRQLTYQVLIDLQRRHFGQKRDPRQEVPWQGGTGTDTASRVMSEAFAAQLTTPSQAAIRAEEKDQLQNMLQAMDPVDREVLALRHFEHLGNNQIAEILGLSATAASNRYVRAMARLSDVMTRMQGEAL